MQLVLTRATHSFSRNEPPASFLTFPLFLPFLRTILFILLPLRNLCITGFLWIGATKNICSFTRLFLAFFLFLFLLDYSGE